MIEELSSLAYDLTWTWDARIAAAFQALDPQLWSATRHNPVAMLERLRGKGMLNPPESFWPAMTQAHAALEQHRQMGEPLSRLTNQLLVGYFSLEFGLTECMPIYSGGLGVLAGDHLKAASDLGVPMVAIGLLYRHGFPFQSIDPEGEQQEIYPEIRPEILPLTLRESGLGPLEVTAPIGDTNVRIRAWRAQVGRIPLYLLDTDFDGNPDELRSITDHLYTPYSDHRLKQEIVLGIGGMRLLKALELPVNVLHLNEGHSFLAGIERIRELREAGLPERQARQAARASVVFTTHTAIAAGSDYFPEHEVHELLGRYLSEAGLSVQELMDLGRGPSAGPDHQLCSTYAALRLAERSFAVSRIHGAVSRHLWRGAWPEVPEDFLPIDHVTNGVHMPAWLSSRLGGLLSWYVGADWWEMDEGDPRWQRIDRIPASDLWELRNSMRRRLARFAARRNATNKQLDPNALTIGFSRRFATYKRATLLLYDEQRLRRLLRDTERPIQFVFAGKAHPADRQGKDLVREVVALARREPRVAFLQDYDMEVARNLVQGCDVWLNNPRRFLEASGTSGMKAAANGVLNLSILDGWWDEAYRPEAGWAIPSAATFDDRSVDDHAEAEALFELLERDVIPVFFDRDESGVPEVWVRMMRASMRHVIPNFSARRMVSDYFYEAYAPAARRARSLDVPAEVRD